MRVSLLWPQKVPVATVNPLSLSESIRPKVIQLALHKTYNVFIPTMWLLCLQKEGAFYIVRSYRRDGLQNPILFNSEYPSIHSCTWEPLCRDLMPGTEATKGARIHFVLAKLTGCWASRWLLTLSELCWENWTDTCKKKKKKEVGPHQMWE